MAADEDDRNSVVVKVLQLLTVLIKFGYYDDVADVNPLLPSIHKLLDGDEDFPTRDIKQFMEIPVVQRREYSQHQTVCQIMVLCHTLYSGTLYNGYHRGIKVWPL